MYIFKVGSAITANVHSSVVLQNGASPDQVFWQVTSAATLNGVTFSGTVVAQAAITLGVNACLFGRALTTAAGTVTMAGNNQIKLDHGPPGTNYCGSTSANSSGAAATIAAIGSNLLADNDLTLVAMDLPANVYGYFMVSLENGMRTPAGSGGPLCLSGTIGRFNEPGFDSGMKGTATQELDFFALPTPTSAGTVMAQVGQTWYFQVYYVDMHAGSTNNFSDAVAVTLP